MSVLYVSIVTLFKVAVHGGGRSSCDCCGWVWCSGYGDVITGLVAGYVDIVQSKAPIG